jgi:hypothetical protein
MPYARRRCRGAQCGGTQTHDAEDRIMSTDRINDFKHDGPTDHPGAERQAIALRVREIREAVFGDSGRADLADLMGVPDQTWANYEAGAMIPSEVILRFIDEVGVTPHWLLTGRGDRYRTARWFSLPHNRN